MSNDPSVNATTTNLTDSEDLKDVQNDPVLHGHSALTDPDLSGSTAAAWTGTGGPDVGGMAGSAEWDRQDSAGRGSSTGDQLGQAVSAAGDQAQQAAGQVVDQAQQVAGQVLDTAKEQTTNRVSAGKDQVATTVDAVAEAIRQSSQGLRDQNQTAVAGYAEQAADRLGGAATYLRERDVPQLIGEAENFARRQPAVFLGAAFGLGLLAARFLKSSRQQAQSQQTQSWQAQRGTGGSSGWQESTYSMDWNRGAGRSAPAAGGAPYAPAPVTPRVAEETSAFVPAPPPAGRVAFRAEAPLPGSSAGLEDELAGDTSDTSTTSNTSTM